MPCHKALLEEPSSSGLACCTQDSKKRKIDKNRRNTLSEARRTKEHEGYEEVDKAEVLLTVSLYHSEKDLKMAQYVVLGSQGLTALRDRMYCLADHILDGPDTKSSFMFIENAFYNDMRSSKAMDYSRHIMLWANEKADAEIKYMT